MRESSEPSETRMRTCVNALGRRTGDTAARFRLAKRPVLPDSCALDALSSQNGRDNSLPDARDGYAG